MAVNMVQESEHRYSELLCDKILRGNGRLSKESVQALVDCMKEFEALKK